MDKLHTTIKCLYSYCIQFGPSVFHRRYHVKKTRKQKLKQLQANKMNYQVTHNISKMYCPPGALKKYVQVPTLLQEVSGSDATHHGRRRRISSHNESPLRMTWLHSEGFTSPKLNIGIQKCAFQKDPPLPYDLAHISC